MKEDRRKYNGGNKNAGRKPKADEIKLIERLTPLADAAYSALEKGIEEGNALYVKMWFEYYYGKPKQTLDVDAKLSGIKNIIVERIRHNSDK